MVEEGRYLKKTAVRTPRGLVSLLTLRHAAMIPLSLEPIKHSRAEAYHGPRILIIRSRGYSAHNTRGEILMLTWAAITSFMIA